MVLQPSAYLAAQGAHPLPTYFCSLPIIYGLSTADCRTQSVGEGLPHHLEPLHMKKKHSRASAFRHPPARSRPPGRPCYPRLRRPERRISKGGVVCINSDKSFLDGRGIARVARRLRGDLLARMTREHLRFFAVMLPT